MKTILVVETFYSYEVEVKLVSRVSTAVDMLFFENKLHTEQETKGSWDCFLENAMDYYKPLKAILGIEAEYFKGREDVIVEIKFKLSQQKDASKELDLRTEQFSGELFDMIKKYFELNNVDIKTSYHKDEIKMLTSLKYCNID